MKRGREVERMKTIPMNTGAQQQTIPITTAAYWVNNCHITLYKRLTLFYIVL
jgi:hypothetical protein